MSCPRSFTEYAYHPGCSHQLSGIVLVWDRLGLAVTVLGGVAIHFGMFICGMCGADDHSFAHMVGRGTTGLDGVNPSVRPCATLYLLLIDSSL